MKDQPQGGPEEARQVAAYVADLTADLARIARRNRLEALGYLLDMARLEAEHAAGNSAESERGVS